MSFAAQGGPLARALVCAGVALSALGPATAAAQDPPRIAPGVSAGGVALGGLTAEQAAARLEAQLGPRLKRAVVVRVAGRRFTFDPAQARVALDAEATARRALAVAPAAAGDGGGGAPAGALVAPAVSHARMPVRDFARRVAAGVSRAPRNARLKLGLRHQRLRRARLGLALDASGLAAAVDAALDDPAASRLVRRRTRKVYPAVNANDLRAQYRTIVTVSKAEFRLRLFKDLKLRKSYGVAIGQPAYPTPEGRFRITEKQVNPVWSVPNSPWAGELGGSTVAGGSAANPLKARWLGITGGVGIHGTGEDWSIGGPYSHGCLRMHVWDVIDLYPRVPVGATVLIR